MNMKTRYLANRSTDRFGSLAAPQDSTIPTAAVECKAAASYKPPRQPSHLIVGFVSIPNLPNLINQLPSNCEAQIL